MGAFDTPYDVVINSRDYFNGSSCLGTLFYYISYSDPDFSMATMIPSIFSSSTPAAQVSILPL